MVVGVLRNNGMASCHADYTAFIPRQKEVDRLIVYVGFSSKLCESASCDFSQFRKRATPELLYCYNAICIGRSFVPEN